MSCESPIFGDMNIKNTIDIDYMIGLYESGYTYEKIANDVGKSKKWVMNKLKGKVKSRPPGVKGPKKYDVISWNSNEERDKLILKLYDGGDGGLVVSKKLGISKKVVYRVLRDNGVSTSKSMSDYKKLSPNDVLEIIDRYDNGASTSEIAKSYDCCEQTICNALDNKRLPGETMANITPDLRDKIIGLSRDGWSSYRIAEKYGWTYQSVQRFLARHNLSPQTGTDEWFEAVTRGIKTGGSSLENKLKCYLDKRNIKYEQQFGLGRFRYDFKIGNVLVEVQGSYWHSREGRRERDFNKANLALDNGYKLVVIWDHEIDKEDLVVNRIINNIEKPVFDFKQCVIKEASWNDAKFLLESFHYQGAGRSGYCVGAFVDDTLAAVVVYTKPVRQEIAIKQGVDYSKILELSRFVIHPSYQSKNFSSWFLSKSIKNLKKHRKGIVRLVTFADLTYAHSGIIYKATNWVFDGYSEPSYWYFKNGALKHKKTVWNAARSVGMSESEYAASKHYIKVVGHSKKRFTFNLK